MAVISELIDVGLSLKEQGNHQGAIEHFRQLNVTYPDNARIMFELAGSWQAFKVPEQSIPLYRQLMAMPKSQGLPPKDMPRLYTQMGAALRLVGQFAESLEIIEEGSRLFPTYRPLRAYHMLALYSAGFPQNAMLEAFELMLESLAPSKWDLYEEEIVAIVKEIRERIPPPNTEELEDWVFDEFWTDEGTTAKAKSKASKSDDVSVGDVLDEASAIMDGDDVEADEVIHVDGQVDEIPTDDEADSKSDDSFDVQVNVLHVDDKATQAKKKPKSSKNKSDDQMGKKAVKIDINSTDDEEDEPPVQNLSDSDDDKPTPTSGKINIPIDLD